ncbi:hypothetical protein BDV98DRAFT_574687 [Pterulicium gracile]|uniref:Carboxylesterase type B domain-containing protein n=1 Tax=Pterulicium gracile TaxID=1884261 RepID=A0A5C3QAC9_9AGAR|nr:hypothetical protein BDV98DRAFT_574687 [Pterula gracilis]
MNVTRTSDFLLPTSLQSEFRASPWLDQSVVDLGYAKYRGMHDEDRDVTEFLGMRYVQSPIGNLRFGAPREPTFALLRSVEDANAHPKQCMQATRGSATANPFSSLTVPAPTTRQEDVERRDATPAQSKDCYS